ncbi:DNA polymerase alpha/epsilon subunit B-domain-containing protein [Scleroderma citrinum]
MSVEKLRSDVAEHFGEMVAADDALLKECISMCRTFNLSAQDLSYKWQAICYNSTQSVQIFTLKSVPDLRAKLQSERTKANAIRQEAMARNLASLGKGRGKSEGLLNPIIAKNFDERLSVGPLKSQVVKVELGDVAGPSRVRFQGPTAESMEGRVYRYMYEKVLERSEVLDDRIDGFAELIQRHYHVDEFGDPASTTEDPITIVGRIVPDADAASSGVKLGESSLVLESSRMMGSGVRVPIRLTPETKLRGGTKGIGGMSFFPGAIVALRGRNGGGGFFLVDEVLAPPPIQAPSPPLSDPNTSFSMAIACGPFTADTDLGYKPWSQLLKNLKSAKPAVLLLIGPFVNADHTRIAGGDTDETPKEIYNRHFCGALQDFLLHSPGSKVLLVPSVRDLISDHAVFPQCAIDAGLCNNVPQIRCLPNPCRFSVNGVSFGVSSVDVLFHLRREEFFRRMQETDPVAPDVAPVTDPMANLARTVLQQRSFYPIFPVPLDVSHEVNLDVTHSEGLMLTETEDDCAPDVLVLSSRLKQFSKVVDTSVVVNPSFLNKGTYAVLSYDGQASGLPRDRIHTEIPRII